MTPADYAALWDPDNLWWSVGSPTRGCFDVALDETTARALADELNRAAP